MGKQFDRNIGYQIFEIVKNENEKMNLSDFIAQYIDTEDTLSFRIDLDKKQMEELILKKEAFFNEKMNLRRVFEEKGDLMKIYSVLNLTIKEANNLESKNDQVNSYVKIQAGDRLFYTVRVNSDKNPVFSQTFEMLLFILVLVISLIFFIIFHIFNFYHFFFNFSNLAHFFRIFRIFLIISNFNFTKNING